MNKKENIAYFDNLKAILIFLVCLGHFLIPVIEQYGRHVFALYTFIYLFHMPTFVFISGFFSKNFVRKNRYEKCRRLFGYIILYLIFTSSIVLIESIFTKKITVQSFLFPGNASWYLLCTFYWMIMIVPCSIFKPIFPLGISIVTALCFGIFKNVGFVLGVTRLVYFFPFFLAGFYLNKDQLQMIRNKKYKLWALLFLIFIFLAIEYHGAFFDKYESILYGVRSFYSFKGTILTKVLLRLGWYLLTASLIVCLIILVPEKKKCFTYIGKNSLGVYIFHVLTRDVIRYLGVYQMFPSKILRLGFIFAISVLCCLIYGLDFFNLPLRKVFSLKYQRLLKNQ